MDGREAMASYYMQRGISRPGIQTSLHSPPGIHTLSAQNYTVQSNIGGNTATGSAFQVDSSATNTIPPHGTNQGMPSAVGSGEQVKRKRGRPRKYGPDGSVSLALAPISSAPPPVSSLLGSATSSSQKRGRGRPPGTGRKQQLASFGEWISDSAGMGFTPHIITISTGEDIATKIMSFSQQGNRVVCILSASGVVSTVTLRQPATSSGTVTYEGRFEILCLSGSYMVTNNGSSSGRTGGLSVSLSSPDGRVIGGGVGGVLIAASPVQVIVGSFSYSGSKAKLKPPSVTDPLASGDKSTAQSGSLSNPNPSPPSLIGSGWPGSRPLDMRNTHMDIDLTR